MPAAIPLENEGVKNAVLEACRQVIAAKRELQNNDGLSTNAKTKIQFTMTVAVKVNGIERRTIEEGERITESTEGPQLTTMERNGSTNGKDVRDSVGSQTDKTESTAKTVGTDKSDVAETSESSSKSNSKNSSSESGSQVTKVDGTSTNILSRGSSQTTSTSYVS
mgnify:CR=1 FL=1